MSGELGAWRSPHTGALRMTRAQAEQLGRRALYLLIAIEAGEIDAARKRAQDDAKRAVSELEQVRRLTP